MCIRDRPGPILCGSISGAPLLPKLRGQLAEFLNNPSPVGLRILSSSTCVGLRYGHLSIQDRTMPKKAYAKCVANETVSHKKLVKKVTEHLRFFPHGMMEAVLERCV